MLRNAALAGTLLAALTAFANAQADSPPLLATNVSLTMNSTTTTDTIDPTPTATPTPIPEGAIPVEAVKAAVRKVLDDQVAAWNRGDLEAFMAGYWSSPDLTFFSGADRTLGWQPTLDRYRTKYQQEGQPMGQLSFPVLDIRPVGPDAAFVRGEWQLIRANETLGGLFTLVFRRHADGWKVVHDHTSAR